MIVQVRCRYWSSSLISWSLKFWWQSVVAHVTLPERPVLRPGIPAALHIAGIICARVFLGIPDPSSGRDRKQKCSSRFGMKSKYLTKMFTTQWSGSLIFSLFCSPLSCVTVSLAPKVSVVNVDSSFFVQFFFQTEHTIASQPKNFTVFRRAFALCVPSCPLVHNGDSSSGVIGSACLELVPSPFL